MNEVREALRHRHRAADAYVVLAKPDVTFLVIITLSRVFTRLARPARLGALLHTSSGTISSPVAPPLSISTSERDIGFTSNAPHSFASAAHRRDSALRVILFGATLITVARRVARPAFHIPRGVCSPAHIGALPRRLYATQDRTSLATFIGAFPGAYAAADWLGCCALARCLSAAGFFSQFFFSGNFRISGHRLDVPRGLRARGNSDAAGR